MDNQTHIKPSMDSNLEFALDDYRDIILEHLFTRLDIKKWKNNEEIIINKHFIPLLKGDWNRRYGNDFKRLDLAKLNGKLITKTKLFKMLITELERKVTFVDSDCYVYNFNPNFFFLFFDDFYGLTVKNFEIIYKPKKINDRIVGINFCNYEQLSKSIRHETLKLIEVHSRFVLNKNFYDIIGHDLFTEIFIEGCMIQYPINNKYIDQSYQIGQSNLLIEINEKQHNTFVDNFRELEIYIENNSRLNNYNLSNIFMTTDIFYKDKLFLDFCKCLYSNGYTNESIILYLVEDHGFELNPTRIGVQIVKGSIKMMLSDIPNIPFFDPVEKIDIDKILIQSYHRGDINPNLDFNNWVSFKKINKQITKVPDSDLITILSNKDQIEVNSAGLINILTGIPSKNWNKRREYIEYINNLQNKYINTIEKLLEDKDNKILIDKYKLSMNVLSLLKYDKNDYYQQLYKKYNRDFISKNFHEYIPFIKRSKNNFVDFELLKKILDKETINKVYEDEISKFNYANNNIEVLLNYQIMKPKEIEELFDIDQCDFVD